MHVAAECGLSVATLINRLNASGLGPDAPISGLLKKLSLDPEAFPTPKRRLHAWEVMRRLAIVANSGTYVRAAREIGCSRGRLGSQIHWLESRLGHTLIELPGHSQRPVILTPLGNTLVHSVTQIDRKN